MKRRKSRRQKLRPAKAPRRARAQARSGRGGKIQNERDPVAALLEASAQALGLTLEPAWHDGIAFHLRLIFEHAARIDGFPLPDDTEPAPVFHA